MSAQIEFKATDDPSAIGAAIRQHGMALVRRGAIDLVPLLPTFDANLKKATNGEADEAFAANVPVQAGSIYMLGGPNAVRSRLGPMPAIAAAFFDAPAAYFDWRLTRMRRIAPSGQRVHGLHQDGVEVSQQTMLTMWASLTDCGRDAPGLELVRVPGLEYAKLAPGEHWSEGENDPKRKRALELFGEDAFWRPQLKGGDAIVFTDKVYHQTHVTPAMTKSRVSVDFRVVMDATNPGEWITPLKQSFISKIRNLVSA